MKSYKIRLYDELDSTNNEAKRLVREAMATGATDISDLLRTSCASSASKTTDLFNAVGTAAATGEPCLTDATNTNQVLSALYETGIVARRQSAGRGRRGRGFFSPGGNSIYASFILKPPNNPCEQLVTVSAAVAVCKAIEKTTSHKPDIKWINDVLIDGKKICGILAETIPNAVILGIGININLNENDLPAELRGIVGSIVLNEIERKILFDTLAETVFQNATTFTSSAIIGEYRARSILLGKYIYVFQNNERQRAFATNVADDGALIVKYENGIVETLRSSEVSVSLAPD